MWHLDRTVRRRSIGEIVLIASLALGPIYWFPLVSFGPMFALRSSLIALLFFIVLQYGLALRKDVLLATILLSCLTLLSSLMHSDLFFLNVVPALLLLVFGSQLPSLLAPDRFQLATRRASAIFGVFCVVVLSDYFGGGFIEDPFYTSYPVYLHDSGFNGGRTAWGYVSNIFLALTLQSYLGSTRPKRGVLLVTFLLVMIILFNILVTGARGAFLVSALLIFVFGVLALIKSRTTLLLPILFFLIGGISLLLTLESAAELRIVSTFLASETRDLSTAQSRITSYSAAFDAMSSNPFYGSGSIYLVLSAEMIQVHNVWLRLITERGVPIGLGIIFSVAALFVMAMSGARRTGYEIRLLLISGVATGFIEPNAIFGNYFSSIAFWIPVGYFIGASDRFSQVNCQLRNAQTFLNNGPVNHQQESSTN